MRPGLAQVRDTQLGVFTGWQVLCEYSRAEMREHIDRGIWVRVFRGVFREASTPPTACLRVEAARLSLGEPRLVAAYGTAARLHGLPVSDDPVTHVLGAPPMRSPRLIVHPDGTDARELALVQGTTATGLVRTVVDMARTSSRSEALAVVEVALRRGVSPAAMFVELEAQRGRRGRVQADELVEMASAAAGGLVDAATASSAPVPGGESAVDGRAAGAGPVAGETGPRRIGPARRSARASRWRMRCASGGHGVVEAVRCEDVPAAGAAR